MLATFAATRIRRCDPFNGEPGQRSPQCHVLVYMLSCCAMVALTTTCRNRRSTVSTRRWYSPLLSPHRRESRLIVGRSSPRLCSCCPIDSTTFRFERSAMAKLQFLLAGFYATSALASPWARIKRGGGWGDNGGPGGYGQSTTTTTEGGAWGYGSTTTCKASTITKTQKASTVYETQKASTVSKSRFPTPLRRRT